MPPNKLYAAWVDAEPLTADELTRALAAALAVSDERTIRRVLGQRHAGPSHIQQIKDDAGIAGLTALLSRRTAAPEDVTWFATTVDVTTARYVLDALQSPEQKLLVQLWDRNDPALRLAVLQKVRWHHRIPKTWERWLLRNRPFTGLAASEREVFSAFARNEPDWMWRIAEGIGDLQVLTWMYEAMSENERDRSDRVDVMRRIIGKLLDRDEHTDAERETIVAALVALGTLGRRRELALSPGSPLVTLAARATEVVAESPRLRDELAAVYGTADTPVTGDQNPQPKLWTREMLLAELADGRLPDEALSAAKACRQASRDPLWRAVARHPQLLPSDAVKLLAALDDLHSLDVHVPFLLADRDKDWCQTVAAKAWRNAQVGANRTMKFIEALPASVRTEFLTEIVRADPAQLEAIVDMRLETDELIGLIPYSAIDRLSTKLARALLHLVRRRLGADTASWDLFDVLSDSFTGTFGELLDAAQLLGQRPVTS